MGIATIWKKLWGFVQMLLTLPRFDLFLQGTLLILVLFNGYTYLLLRRSALAGLLPREIEDWVIMGASVAEFLLGDFLGWFGRRRRHLALSSWLGVVGVCGLLVLAFPQPNVEIPSVELCGGSEITTTDAYSTTTDGFRTALLVVIAVLSSLAKISVWAHGITYLDDHDPKNGVYVYGILISITVSVGLNARSWFAAHSASEDWWKGQLSLSVLIIMFSVLFTLFPKRMPGWPMPEEAKEGTGFIKTALRVLSNKVVLIQILALSLLSAGIWGFAFNSSEYLRTRYHFEEAPDWTDGRTTTISGDIFRTFIIVYFVMIFRARFSRVRDDGVKSTTGSKVGAVLALLAAALFFVLTFLRCTTADIAGQSDEYEQPQCSQQCGCDSQKYGFAPVCALNTLTTYFSPCHAGCSESNDLHSFVVLNNCTCLGGGSAVLGECNRGSCQVAFAVFQIIYVNALAFGSASLLMQGMVILRAVRWSDKATAVGLCFGTVALITYVPGLLLYNFIDDATCAFREGSSCLLHRESFSTAVAATSGALLALSAACSALAFLVRRSQLLKGIQ